MRNNSALTSTSITAPIWICFTFMETLCVFNPVFTSPTWRRELRRPAGAAIAIAYVSVMFFAAALACSSASSVARSVAS